MSPRAVLSQAALLLLAPSALALAQNDHSWEKTYPLSAAPSLKLQVGDSDIRVHACSGCHAVHVRVTTSGIALSEYILNERQDGNTVQFSLKEKPHTGFHMSLHRATVVEVETPSELHLEASAGDGSLELEDLHGSLTLHTGDGAQRLQNLSGDLHLSTGDGNISLQRGSGTLEAHTGDGHIDALGAFSALQVHTGDGNVRINLAQGSHLSAASSIQSGDGNVTVQLPGSFPANLDLRTGDGHIESGLPLTVDNYSSHSGHNIQGKLDGGGVPLNIHTADGNIHLSRS